MYVRLIGRALHYIKGKKVVRKTKAETEQTYNALLDAAMMLFTRQGVARTTLNNIAQEAQMTRGAVYWHFDNKDAVIRALWDRNACKTHEMFTESMELLSASDNAGECVRETLKSALRELMGDPKVGQVMRIVFNNVEFTDEKTPLQEFLIEHERKTFVVMEQVFEALAAQNHLKVNQSPAFLSRSLLAYMRGLLDMQLAPKGHGVDLVKDGDAYIDLFFDAVLA